MCSPNTKILKSLCLRTNLQPKFKTIQTYVESFQPLRVVRSLIHPLVGLVFWSLILFLVIGRRVYILSAVRWRLMERRTFFIGNFAKRINHSREIQRRLIYWPRWSRERSGIAPTNSSLSPNLGRKCRCERLQNSGNSMRATWASICLRPSKGSRRNPPSSLLRCFHFAMKSNPLYSMKR